MGIGFVATIVGVILAGPANWKYAYLYPYSHQMLAIRTMLHDSKNKPSGGGTPTLAVDIFTNEIFVSMIVAVAVFIIGYFIVLKKSVK